MDKKFTTSDLGLSAYILMKGVEIIEVKNTRPFTFVFKNEGNICNNLSIEFLNSEASRYDASMKKIKLILKNSNQ